MLSILMTATQQVVVHVPERGKDKRGRPAVLEGPAVITIDPDPTGAAFASVELDPTDPNGLTVVMKSLVNENTQGQAPFLVTGTIGRDAKVGQEVQLITENWALNISNDATEAVSFELTADAPTEIDEANPPAQQRRVQR